MSGLDAFYSILSRLDGAESSAEVQPGSPTDVKAPEAPEEAPPSAFEPPRRRVHYAKPLGPGPCHVYSMDGDSDVKANLLVNPVTRAKYKLSGSPPLAIDDTNLCYVVRTGDLRVLSNQGGKGVLKGFHEGALTDAAFFDETSRLLATASDDLRVLVQRVVELPADASQPEQRVEAEPVLGLRFAGAATPSPAPSKLSWHPRSARVLAVSTGRHVSLVRVPDSPSVSTLPVSDLSGVRQSALSLDTSLLPMDQCAAVEEGDIVRLAFSPSGNLLAAITDAGDVAVWSVALHSSSSAHPAAFTSLVASFRPNQGAEFVGWIPLDPESPLASVPTELLVTLGSDDRHGQLELQTWDMGSVDSLTPSAPLETVIFSSAAPPPPHAGSEPRTLAVLCPNANLVLALSGPRKTLYAVRYRPEPAAPYVSFECVTPFPIAAGVHSLGLMGGPEPQEDEDEEGGARGVTLVGLLPSGLHKFDMDLAAVQPPPHKPLTLALSQRDDRGLSGSPPSESDAALGGAAPGKTPVSMPLEASVSQIPEASPHPGPPPMPDLISLLARTKEVEATPPALPPMPALLSSRGPSREPSKSGPDFISSPFGAPPPPFTDDAEEPLDSGSALLQALQRGPLSAGGEATGPAPSAPPMPAEGLPLPLPLAAASPRPEPAARREVPRDSPDVPVTPPLPVRILKRSELSSGGAVAVVTRPNAAAAAAAPAPVPPAVPVPATPEPARSASPQLGASSSEAPGRVAVELKKKVEQSAADVKTLLEAVKALKAKVDEQGKLLAKAQAPPPAPKPEEAKKAAQAQAALVAAELKGAIQLAVKAEVQKAVQETLPKALGLAIGDALRTEFSARAVPAFEAASRQMLEQLQTAVIRGLEEYVQPNNAHLAASLQRSLESAATLGTTLRHSVDRMDRADMRGHGPTSSAPALLAPTSHPPTPHTSAAGAGPNGPPSPAVDQTHELRQLLHTRQFSAAFERALNTRNHHLVSWLCREAGEAAMNDIFGASCHLSQICLLVLIQQLGWDLSTELRMKVEWMQSAAVFLNPRDAAIAAYVRPTLDTALNNLKVALAGPAAAAHAKDLRLLIFTLEKIVGQPQIL